MSEALQHETPITLPTELLMWILRYTVLQNIHSRLTQELYNSAINWNSLIILPQVCHIFREICTQICASLLGAPTPEQKEGLWHAKSPLGHTVDAVEHLFRISPSRHYRLTDAHMDACMVALLDVEYRANALQLPGLLGLYEATLSSRLIRTAAFKRGLVHPLQHHRFMRSVEHCLDALCPIIGPASRVETVSSPQVNLFTSELRAECFFNRYGFFFWTTACFVNAGPSDEALPWISDHLMKIQSHMICKLNSMDALGLEVGLHVHDSVGVLISTSSIIPVLKRTLMALNERDPVGVKPKVKDLLVKCITISHGKPPPQGPATPIGAHMYMNLDMIPILM